MKTAEQILLELYPEYYKYENSVLTISQVKRAMLAHGEEILKEAAEKARTAQRFNYTSTPMVDKQSILNIKLK